MLKKTKIIATIGPASKDIEVLKEMINAGMDVVRINSAHGSIEKYKEIIKNLNNIYEEKKLFQKKIPVLLDVKGPEIRIISDNEYKLNYNDKIEIFIYDEKELKKNTNLKNNNLKLKTPYFNHKFNPKKNAKVLINDGLNELEIVKINKNSIVLRALMPLIISNKVRANIPGINYDSEILSANDKKVIIELKNMFDYLALSYVRNKEDIIKVRKFLRENHIEDIIIISKIENIDAVKNFDEILDSSDAIMVARGDLGVELPAEKIPIIQKEIIKKCNKKGKAVITATQMLQSMVNFPIPTRAETSDVANSILDGTDAIMLSAETATGMYPINSVKEMTKIAKEVEPYVKSNVILDITESISEATAKSIFEISKLLKIKKIIAFTHSGFTARMLSRFRLKQPIYAICNEKTRKELVLYYGIIPFVFSDFNLELFYEKNISKFIKYLLNEKKLNKDDLILIAKGKKPKETNIIEVEYVKEYLNNKN